MEKCFNYDSFQQTAEKYVEYWNGENHKRPLISIVGRDPFEIKYPKYASLEERWMDIEYMLQRTNEELQHSYFGCEAFPLFFPDLGPDQFAGFHGTKIEFGESTSWARPDLTKIEDFSYKKFDRQNIYYKKTIEMLHAMVEDGRDRYIVGITDLHPGMDGLVSMRGPQEVAIDTIENDAFLKTAVMKLFDNFITIYNEMYEITTKYQKGSSNWTGLWHPGKYYVTSCDFCCMISMDMFEEFVVAELEKELDFLDASIFHLDGPGALKHLDRLLQIKKLNGIQWVYGAGAPSAPNWIHVIEKIQNAGKLVQMDVEAKDLPYMIENVKPEGIMYKVYPNSTKEAKELEEYVEKITN